MVIALSAMHPLADGEGVAWADLLPIGAMRYRADGGAGVTPPTELQTRPRAKQILSLCALNRNHKGFPPNAERREIRADRVGDVGGGEVGVVLFSHASISMA